jgi:LemA protein
MKPGRIITIVVAVLLAFFLFRGCSGYNGLVKQDEVVKEKWNNVQSDYQRRADLIPNLVNTVKGEANFEQQTLINVIEARSKATSVKVDPSNITPEKLAEFQQAQSGVSSALGRLLAVVESYPNLKANEGFRNLQTQLEGTENRIKVARNDFNTAVKDYNTQVRSFPMNLFAGMFGFKTKEGFAAEAGSDKAPEVKF